MRERRLDEKELAEFITQVAGVAVAGEQLAGSPGVAFSDLGVDSLAVMGIVAAVENNYEIRIGDEANTCATPAELQGIVNDALASEATNARPY